MSACTGVHCPGWGKVYSHDITGGLFANLEEAKKKNIDDENSKLFSRLYDLESMKDKEDVFHFKLCYIERTDVEFPCNEWKQSSNPLTEKKVTGYEKIRLTWPLQSDKRPFEGLVQSTPDKNLIDDSEGSNWGNSIGTIKDSKGKIPGPIDKDGNQIYVEKTELYAYFDPLGNNEILLLVLYTDLSVLN